MESVIIDLLASIIQQNADELSLQFALTRENHVEPLDIAKLAIACEAYFGMTLHDERIAQWRLLSDAAAYIEELLEDGQDQPALRSDEERVAWYYE